jgi:hypothetical protein
MLNIDISSCDMMQTLPEHLIHTIILYNRHPIAEIFNNNLFIDYEFTNKLAIHIVKKHNKTCYEYDYIFIVEDGDEYANKILFDCCCNKLNFEYIDNQTYNYMNTIKGRIYKPDGKTEQNYKARVFKNIENYYNTMYEFNFNKTFIYYLVRYHMEIITYIYRIRRDEYLVKQ